MILRTLHLSGFGVFCDQELADLSPELNVIEGPNEAGKSTTVEFIRTLLFGFQRGPGKRIYEPLSGGDHGGWALVRDRQGRDLRWEVKARKNPAAGLRLVSELGGQSGIDPAVFLGGADRELFSNVFAFSLEEMAGLKALEKEEVHARIYAAASGGGGASLFTASDMIEKKRADLFRPNAPTTVLHGLLRERKVLADALERLGDGVEAYNVATQRHNAVRDQLAAVRAEESAAREVLSRAETAASAWEPWLDLREVKTELESLAEIESFPDDGLARLEKSLQALQSHQERLAEAEDAVELLTRRLEGCRLDPPVHEARATLQALTERQSEYLGARRDRADVTQSCDHAAREGAEALGRLGPGWTEERVHAFDRSIRREEEIRTHRDALLRADAEARAQEERLTTADDHLANRRKQLNDAKAPFDAAYPEPPPALPDHTGRVNALDAAESHFRRSDQQQGELRPLQDRLADLELRVREAEAEAQAVREPLSPWLGFVPMAGFQVLGIVLKDNAPLAITLALVGLTCLIGWYVFAKAQGRSLAASRKRHMAKAEELEQQHEALQKRYSQLQSELDSAAEQSYALLAPFGLTCETADDVRLAQRDLAAAVQARERYENERLTFETLERELESAREEVEKARRRLKVCRKEHAAAGESWKAWLWQRGLPAEISPETVLRLFDEAKQALKSFRDRDHEAERVASMTAVIDGFETEVNDLCRRLERPEPGPEGVVATLRTLSQEADTQSKLFLQHEELSKQREEAVATVARLKGSARSLHETHRSLLTLSGAETEEAFREKAQNWSRKQALQSRRHELDRRLDGISGPGGKRAALEATLAEADPQTLALCCVEARNRVSAIVDRREALLAEGAVLTHQLLDLENADEITAKQRVLAAKDAEIAEASEQWAVLRLTSWLLERTRKKFETERQPAVIRNAGAMMSRLTGGRYSAVVAPEGLTDIALETPQGERKKLEAWSRGTREQLYLALRFAFVLDYSAHSEPLPIIMDDVLVHADGYQRRRNAAETIAEVAQKCQVLYFTCHPDHAELLASACPGAHRYSVEDGRFSRIA